MDKLSRKIEVPLAKKIIKDAGLYLVSKGSVKSNVVLWGRQK